MEAHQRLEQKWAEFNGLDPVGMVACSSGTAALHLALEAFRLPPGSEVIVPDLTMIACPRAVTLAGLTPVFVDCDERLLMRLNALEDCLAPLHDQALPTAIMLVFVYGRMPDWAKFQRMLTRQAPGRFIVEDLAEAHGIYPNKRTDAACWSFYRNKVVAGEEGGAVWFRNQKHAALARQLRTLGFTDAHDFWHVPRGHNYRMSNLHALCILGELLQYKNESSLPNYSRNLGERRLSELAYEVACPPEWRMPERQVPWVYDFRVPGMRSAQQDAVVRALQVAGFAARHCFKPCSEQEEYWGCRVVSGGRGGSAAGVASQEVIYLPLFPAVSSAEAARAFDVVKKALAAPITAT